MKQYLLSIYQPDGDPPPADVLAQIDRDLQKRWARSSAQPARGCSPAASTRRARRR